MGYNNDFTNIYFLIIYVGIIFNFMFNINNFKFYINFNLLIHYNGNYCFVEYINISTKTVLFQVENWF